MRKNVCLILTLALMLALLTACAPGGAPQLPDPPVSPETTTAPAETTAPTTTPEPTGTLPEPTESVPATTEPLVPTSADAPAPTNRITRDEAIGIALKHAGVNRDQVRQLEAELDTDDGIVHYDVDFEYENYDYDYEIQADTGKILKAEKERD